jgi:hypothetical protein
MMKYLIQSEKTDLIPSHEKTVNRSIGVLERDLSKLSYDIESMTAKIDSDSKSSSPSQLVSEKEMISSMRWKAETAKLELYNMRADFEQSK